MLISLADAAFGLVSKWLWRQWIIRKDGVAVIIWSRVVKQIL